MIRGFSRSAAALLLVLIAGLSLAACGVTMNPVKRKPLQIESMEASLTPSPDKVLIRFENTISDKPLAETVWDNVSGAFWDVRESNQIGYTQNYDRLVPAVALGEGLGGVIGGAIVGASAGDLIETRIVIPFGRIFEGVFQSGISKAFPGSPVCFDDQCESQTLKADAQKYLVRIAVVEFQVWEQPLNHINFRTFVVSKVYRSDNVAAPAYTYESRQQLVMHSIGSVMSTSSGFIAEMNKISNRFAGTVARDIIDKLQKDLQNS